MDGRVLGLAVLLASPLLASADGNDIRAKLVRESIERLRKRCSIQYWPREPCLDGVPRINENNCRRFQCCIIPNAPPGGMNCYRPKSLPLDEYEETGPVATAPAQCPPCPCG